MKKSVHLPTLALVCLSLFVIAPNAQAGDAEQATPKIIRLDKRFDSIVPKDAVLEKLSDGHAWVEGPVWNRKGQFLLFSDVPNNSILKWKEKVSLFLKPSGYSGKEPFSGREPGSNGLTFDRLGRLVFCQHGDRRISRLEAKGTRTTLVDRFEGKRLNSPNDVVFDSKGNMYFTDPPFGLPKSFDDPARELDFCGVYRLGADGRLTVLTKELIGPNGIGFSPDERILYVSDITAGKWMAFDVQPDGTIANGRLLLDATEFKKAKPGGPDGLKLDRDGNIYGAGPGGLYIIAPDGTYLGGFEFGVPIGNCAWGEDGSSLFIAANTAIYRIRLHSKGATF